MLSKEFHLNDPQAKALLVNANKTWLVWGRGTGKTTGTLGPKMVDLVLKMERAKGGFIGKDYPQIYERTLPPILSAWESLGYQKEIHWRIGPPLPDWELPLVPPVKWDNCITWYNGTVIMLLSLSVQGIGNSLSLQWVCGDEAKFWPQDRLLELLKAVRGLKKEFGHHAEYLCQWFATDKWVEDVADIQWILDHRKKYLPAKVETIFSLQLEVNELKSSCENLSGKTLQDIQSKISHYELLLNALRKTTTFFSEASAEENEIVLGPEYRISQQQELDTNEFDVAIDNKDPQKSRSAYYPAITKDIHYYHVENDIHPGRPLIIAGDYQASINPLVVAQYSTLPGINMDTLNFVRTVYELHPKGLKEACDLFSAIFQNHCMKELYYVYDHTAIGKNPFSKSYRDLVVEILTAAGWIVVEIYTGKTPEHGIRFERIKEFYTNNDPIILAPIRINSQMNEVLKISLERTRAIQTGGDTKKDKKHEDTRRYPKYSQIYTTHIPDAHDQLLWATHELKMVPLIAPDDYTGGLR